MVALKFFNSRRQATKKDLPAKCYKRSAHVDSVEVDKEALDESKFVVPDFRLSFVDIHNRKDEDPVIGFLEQFIPLPASEWNHIPTMGDYIHQQNVRRNKILKQL